MLAGITTVGQAFVEAGLALGAVGNKASWNGLLVHLSKVFPSSIRGDDEVLWEEFLALWVGV